MLNYEILYKNNQALNNPPEIKEKIKNIINKKINSINIKEFFLDYNFTDDFLNVFDISLILETRSGKVLKLGFLILNNNCFLENDLKLDTALNYFNLNHVLKWDILYINNDNIDSIDIEKEIDNFIFSKIDSNELIN